MPHHADRCPRCRSSAATPSAGGTFPPPSQVTNRMLVMRVFPCVWGFGQAGGQKRRHARSAPAREVAAVEAQELPGVDVGRDDEEIDQRSSRRRTEQTPRPPMPDASRCLGRSSGVRGGRYPPGRTSEVGVAADLVVVGTARPRPTSPTGARRSSTTSAFAKSIVASNSSARLPNWRSTVCTLTPAPRATSSREISADPPVGGQLEGGPGGFGAGCPRRPPPGPPSCICVWVSCQSQLTSKCLSCQSPLT